MRAKREKTEFGSVKAVIPRRKGVVYGTVVPPMKVDNSSEGESSPEHYGLPAESTEDTEEEMDGTPVTPEPSSEGESSPDEGEPDETMEKLRKLVESMEDYAKQKAEEEEKKKEEEEKPKEEKSEEEQKKDEQQKQKEEDENKLTKYLTLQLKLRALGEIFGAVKIAEKDKQYFSYCAFEGDTGYTVYRTAPAPKNVVVALDVYPFFETQDQAEAFLELCEVLMKDYGQLAVNLEAQSIASIPIKVTYPTPPSTVKPF